MDVEALRLRLYRQLAEEGRVAASHQIAAELGVTDEEADQAFRELARARHIVPDHNGFIELAHPFATRDFGFSVKGVHTLWWGGCAWDSFAIPHLVDDGSPALVATTCPACGTAHAWNVNRDHAPAGGQVAHFLVPMAHVWDNVIHTCENQRIFCSEDCVDDWVRAFGHTKGAVFSLETLWKLASKWYSGRLERGYRRREPAEAAAYFRGVGLTGEFWGNGSLVLEEN
ncbi:organomercurial lyase [Sinomonas sp. ASV322]|uniref:organomercurial lyase n=1 Tax=Sinomonas sp. ASV322 TaxID=3041920 RepID=UPI0027DD7638|nr:organomercurial lyase [Sinomonas sp. ASV322]MDQ4501295.1 organomercurial lyase [Sinomonas sp. ASV322]